MALKPFHGELDPVGPASQPGTGSQTPPKGFRPFHGKLDSDKNRGLLGDLGTDLKRGTLQLPGIAAGLLDIPVAGVTGKRLVGQFADAAGEFTGFQPGKWSDEAREQYSLARQAGTAEIDEAWEDGKALDIAKAYARNPGNVAGLIAESLPQMAAGGLAGRVAITAGRAAKLLKAPATTTQAARQIAGGAGLGEGAVIAGGTMDQIDESVDPRRAAAASLGAGSIGGAIGYGGARLAQKTGLMDPESVLAGGAGAASREAPGAARRIAGGALTEGVLEELPQSAQETMWQNWAEERPLTEGVPRAAVEGALAGAGMGAGVNILPARKLVQPQPTQDNPVPAPVEAPPADAGSLSRAANLLPAPDPVLALPAPESAVFVDSAGQAQQVGPVRNVDGVMRPEAQGRPPVPAGMYRGGAWEQQAPAGRQPNEVPAEQVRREERAFADQGRDADQPEPSTLPTTIAGKDLGDGWAAFTEDSGTKGIPRADMPQIKAEHRGAMVNFMKGRGIEHREETVPAASLKPTQAEFSPEKVAKAKQFDGGNRAILVSSDGHVLDGHHQWMAARDNGDEVRVIRLDAPIETLLTAAREFPSSTVDDASAGQGADARPSAIGLQLPKAGPSSQPAKSARKSEQKATRSKSSRSGPAMPDILSMSRKRYIARQAQEAGLKKGSPGYDAAIKRLEDRYEDAYDQAAAALSFEQFNELNKESPESLNRQAWEQLREEYSLPAFARRDGQGGGVTLLRNEVQAIVDAFLKKYKGANDVRVEIHDSAETLPSYRANRDSAVSIQAEYDFRLGTVHLVGAAFSARDRQSARSKIERTLREEILVHKGLGVLSPVARQQLYAQIRKAAEENAAIKRLWDQTVADYQPVAESAGLTKEQADRYYAEELLGTLAQRKINWATKGWNRLLRALKNLAASIGLIKHSDGPAELVRAVEYIADAFAKGRRARRRNLSQDVRGSLDEAPPSFARTAGTRAAYERRIDDLYAGAKPNIRGALMLDRADVLDMLGISDGPVHVAEGKILQGTVNHRLTAEHWKRVPDWLENPVAVFDSETVPGRLVFFGPELVAGKPVRMIVEPRSDGGGVNLLVNAYEADRNPVHRWVEDGLLRYVDERKTPDIERSGLRLPRLSNIRGYKRKIYSGRDLFKYRASRTGGTNDGDVPAFSRADENLTDEALRKLGLKADARKGLVERIRELTLGELRALTGEWGKRTEEGVFDGLNGIKKAEEAVGVTDPNQQGYVSARLATGIADVMHAVMHYGAPEWRDGIVSYRSGTRGLLEVLGDLGGDNLTNWLGWVGGKRAQMLQAQGRENNLTTEEIQELLDLGKGKEELFERVYRDYAKINEAVLDLAQEAGLVTAGNRAKWATDYYVPFYRTDEQGLFLAPGNKRGLSHQTAGIKALKGGKLPTNDLLENILTNWTRRIDASMKNKALLEVVDNLKGSSFLTDESIRYTQAIIPRAEIAKRIRKDRKMLSSVADMLGLPEGSKAMKVASELMKPENEGFEKLYAATAPADPDIVRVQRDGRNEYFRVNDMSLLRGLKHIQGSVFNDPITRIGRQFKRILTVGVTASPDFILRNFIRDAAHAWVINKDGYTLGKDSLAGLKKAYQEDADYRELMFAGSSFQGGYVHGNDPEAAAQIIRRALQKKGLTRPQRDAYMNSLLTTPAKVAGVLSQGWQKYRNVSDKVENSQRLGTYKAARDAGKSRRQAAFEAKDLMDYSLRGNFAAAQWFTDVVPFLNARLQGLYKLGRAAKGDKSAIAREVAIKGGYLAAFTLMLAALNGDDERYKGLPEWDKDMNWHIWLGDQHFRIPKPFELGIIFGTIPERLLHSMTGQQDGGQLRRAIARGFFETLSFNPVPQFYQPIREIQANRNFFRDRPIETMADEGKLAWARYDHTTSALGRAVGQVTGRLWGLSPKQVDHLVQAYTGTLGGYVLGISSIIADIGQPGQAPSWRASDLPVVKVLYSGSGPRSTQYHTDFYDMLSEADQVYRTVRAYREEGRMEAAAKLMESEADKLKHRQMLGMARQQFGAIRKRMGEIHKDESLGGAEKRQMLNALQEQSNQIAERVVRIAKADF